MGVHWPVDRGGVAAIKEAPPQTGLNQGMQCHCEQSKRFASVSILRTRSLRRSRIPQAIVEPSRNAAPTLAMSTPPDSRCHPFRRYAAPRRSTFHINRRCIDEIRRTSD
jgi:hypothetical protein